MRITNTRELAEAFRQGSFSSIGSYPLFFITADGEALSHAAVRENYRLIVSAIRNQDDPQWCVIELDVNWEDPALFCADSGERIPSAYAEDEAEREVEEAVADEGRSPGA